MIKIGPLITQPPVAGLLKDSNAVFAKAGLMAGPGLFMPYGMDGQGMTLYSADSCRFSPLMRATNLSSRALDEYKKVGGDPFSDTEYSRQAALAESAFSMPMSVITSVFERESLSLEHRPKRYDEMMDRLCRFGDMNIKNLSYHLSFANSGAETPISTQLLNEISEDVEYVAAQVWRPEEPDACRTAGIFFMVAGLLRLINLDSDTKRQEKVQQVSRARDAFVASARQFAEGRMSMAAALVQEMAGFLNYDIPDDVLDRKREVFQGALNYWHKAAMDTRGEDRAAHAIAVNRGLIVSQFAGKEAVELRGRMFELSAELNTAIERHADAARDYLRVAIDAIDNADWSPRNWERIADVFRSAIDAYKKNDRSRALIEMLEELETLCIKTGSSLRNELASLDAALNGDPTDIKALSKRGVVYRQYGAYDLAKTDLRLADALSPGDAWILSELGLLSHFMGLARLEDGNEIQGQKLLSEAMRYFNRSLQAAERGGISDGLLYARRGALMATVGRMDNALADMERASRESPKDVEISTYFELLKTKAPGPTSDRSKGLIL